MKDIIEQLANNREVFVGLLKNINQQRQLWRPSPEKWCLLEIVCHLYDEERDDFRFRTQWCLERPDETPPPFDPIVWVVERDYSEQDYNEMLLKFNAERDRSIDWLRGLKDAPWENGFTHPKLGRMTARTYLVNWLAHDYLHIRQILRYRFELLKQQGEDLRYAGNW
ncbi:DinB family protein [Sungkyunkwania multivorans]|uniref:DinB family protein n=1 Tax=Sungkyunkwania multivorans TaxID=1173618 RepID=A0ABW3D2U3_9FLAO